MKKRLIEEMRRMSELAGFKLNENLIKEATNKIDGNDGIVILISDFVKNHIMTHNKVGAGSIFKSGVNEAEIIKMVTQVAPKVSGDGGAYELNQSGIGYDLVLPMEAAKKLPDAVEGTVEKQEGQNKVTVPSISTSQPIQKFVTNRISLIIRKSNPQFLPDDVKADENVLGKIKEGKCYSLLTAFPGNPDIPKSSEWGGKFAVILPGQKPQGNAKPEQQAQNQPVSENKKTRKITLNELRRLVKQVINENEDSATEKAKQALIELLNLLRKGKRNLFTIGGDLENIEDTTMYEGTINIRWEFQGEYFETEFDVVTVIDGRGGTTGRNDDPLEIWPISVEIKENQLFITTHDEDDYWNEYDEEQKTSASKIKVDIQSVAPSFKENLEKSLLDYYDAYDEEFS